MRAHACSRDDAHVYACGANVGAHAGAFAGAGSRTCGCTYARARVCLYDYYIIICAGVLRACVCARTCVYVRAFERICVRVCGRKCVCVCAHVRVRMCVCAYNYII